MRAARTSLLRLLLLAPVLVLASAGCGDDDDPARPAPGPTVHEVDGSWSCAAGTSCQDVYDFELAAGAEVQVKVGSVTGSSVVRLAVFAPGTDLDGTNVLTEVQSDRMCTGRDEADSASFSVGQAGIYRVAVGRDAGASVGSGGSYHLELNSDLPFTVVGRTEDDVASQASGAVCRVSEISFFDQWSCDTDVDCMDVWEVEASAGTRLTVGVRAVTEGSALRWAVFEPGETYDGANLLTGTNLDRMCGDAGEGDEVTLDLTVDGVYRVAVGRDWDASTGGAGQYELYLRSDRNVTVEGQAADNLPSLAVGTVCYDELVSDFSVPGFWDCATAQSCGDSYDFDFDGTGAAVEIGVNGVSGQSVPLLLLYGPGVDPGGVNLLTGDATARECAGRNEGDTVALTLEDAGTYRLLVGRDDEDSVGDDGEYRLTVSSDQLFTASPVSGDAPLSLPGSVCSTRDVVTSGSWTCDPGESCQDVYRYRWAAGTEVDLSALEIDGQSAVRLAVFAPGSTLDGTNLLTGDGTDRLCGGPEEDQVVSFVASTAGVYQVAVGRDAAASTGDAGTYALRVQADLYFEDLGRSVDDGASQAGGTSCPVGD